MTTTDRHREEIAQAVMHELLDGLYPWQREVVETLLRGADVPLSMPAPRHGKAQVERIIRDLHGLIPRHAPGPAPFLFVEDPLPPWPPLPPALSEATINHLRMGSTSWEDS